MRVEYAQRMLNYIKENPKASFVFVDETTVEYGRHPKAGEFTNLFKKKGFLI